MMGRPDGPLHLPALAHCGPDLSPAHPVGYAATSASLSAIYLIQPPVIATYSGRYCTVLYTVSEFIPAEGLDYEYRTLRVRYSYCTSTRVTSTVRVPYDTRVMSRREVRVRYEASCHELLYGTVL